MKKIIKQLILSLLLPAVFVLCFNCSQNQRQSSAAGEYDKTLVVKTMIDLKQTLQALKNSVEKAEFSESKTGFNNCAELLKKLQNINPYKGSKEEWRANHNEIIAICNQAAVACDNKDAQTVRDCLKKISELQQAGHHQFK